MTCRFEGVYTPIVAPFTAGDELDLDVYARLVEFLLDGGVRGLVPNGTTGEYYALSFEERARAARARARRRGRPRAAASPAATRPSTREVIRHGEVARELGYDALLLAAPPTSLPTQRELAAHYTTVADAVGLPIVLYNFPARAGVEIGLECLDASPTTR